MKKSLKGKSLIILLISIIFLMNMIPKSFAAGSFSVTSSKSLTVGGTSSISIFASNCEGKVSISSSDSSIVSISSSSEWIDSNGVSISITGNKEGTAIITVTAVDVSDTEENYVTGSRTCTVKVSSQSTITPTTTITKKSNDSKLKALAVAEGAISPEFSSSLKEYTLSIPNEITEVNVAATANNSRATYIVSGNKELKEGENTVNVTVKAEDGSTSVYTIKITRAKAELALSSLGIKYKDNDKKEIVLKLAPEYITNIYEYTLEDLEYYVKKLDIEAIANREEAIVAIVGNEELKEGKNIITITLKIPAQGDEEEQTKTYTITVNKKAEPIPPTMIEKISSWISSNKMMVIIISLATCVTLLMILSIYIIIDNFKYRKIIKDLKEKTGDIKEPEEVKENQEELEENESKEKEEDNSTEEPEEK